MPERLVFQNISIPAPRSGSIDRAQIHFRGVDQSGPSFAVRVFLNNPSAGIHTPQNPENGYAGSFHIYGFGLSHEKKQTKTLTDYSITATEAIRSALKQGSQASITLVPHYYNEPLQSAGDVLRLNEVSVETS